MVQSSNKTGQIHQNSSALRFTQTFLSSTLSSKLLQHNYNSRDSHFFSPFISILVRVWIWVWVWVGVSGCECVWVYVCGCGRVDVWMWVDVGLGVSCLSHTTFQLFQPPLPEKVYVCAFWSSYISRGRKDLAITDEKNRPLTPLKPFAKHCSLLDIRVHESEDLSRGSVGFCQEVLVWIPPPLFFSRDPSTIKFAGCQCPQKNVHTHFKALMSIAMGKYLDDRSKDKIILGQWTFT